MNGLLNFVYGNKLTEIIMCTPNKIISQIFTPFQDYIKTEQDIREVSCISVNPFLMFNDFFSFLRK